MAGIGQTPVFLQFPPALHPNRRGHRSRGMSAAFLGQALAFYAVVGACTALAFVTVGVGRVLAQPATFTIGARLLLVPGAAMLWPYVLYRWAGTRRRRAGIR